MKTGLIDLPLQPIIDIEKPWPPSHAFAPNPSNPMESEMLPIEQVFRTVQMARPWFLLTNRVASVLR